MLLFGYFISFFNREQVLSQQITQGIASSLEQMTAELLNFYGKKQNFDNRQTHEQQAILQNQLASLTQAVENMAVFLQKIAESNIQPTTPIIDEQQLEAQRQQFAQLATILQKTFEPIVMRLDEKLQVDIQTEQTGKLIVANLQKLTKIFEQE